MSKKNKKNKKGKSASSGAKSEAASDVIANVRLVTALKAYDTSREQTKSILVEVGRIAQEEQLSKAEVVASLVAARGCTEKTAKEQYSRMKKIFSDPEALAELESGEADLRTIREKTKKTQKNPSAEVAAKNAQLKFTKGLGMVVNYAKEQGADVATIINTVKAALKKAGVK